MATTQTRTKKITNRIQKKENSNIELLGSLANASPGWNAVFVDEEDSEIWFEPIACFAMCKKDGIIFAGSIISQDEKGLVVAENAANFLGVSPPGEDEDLWDEIAELKFSGNSSSDEDKEEEEEEDEDEEEEEEVIIETRPRTRRRTIK